MSQSTQNNPFLSLYIKREAFETFKLIHTNKEVHRILKKP